MKSVHNSIRVTESALMSSKKIILLKLTGKILMNNADELEGTQVRDIARQIKQLHAQHIILAL